MYQFGPRLTPMVQNLIIINCIVFLIQKLSLNAFLPIFAFNPEAAHIYLWQFLTYAFLHGGLMHILFNMLSLWMFGSELEDYWNKSYFLKFYLFCCITGAAMLWVANFLGWPQGIAIGASGGVYGVLIAYAMIWPEREVLFFGFFPMKVKYMVGILMLMIAFSQDAGIAHMAHLGGAMGGFLFVKYGRNYFFSSLSRFSLISWFQKKTKQKKDFQQKLAREELDRILDKISQHGIHSLSEQEKIFLNRYSKKK